MSAGFSGAAAGWLAAATDRQILLWNLNQDSHNVIDVSLIQLTHMAINPDEFGLALIQERDRIGRLTPAGRWIWKHELREPVEDLAIGPNGHAAVTTHGGQLVVFDPAGARTVGFTFDPSDPPLLIEAPEKSPPSVGMGQPRAPVAVAARAWASGRSSMGESDPLGALVPDSAPGVDPARGGRRTRSRIRRHRRDSSPGNGQWRCQRRVLR